MEDKNSHASLIRFLQIIEKLRDPNNGCPWDIKQTFQSLAPLLIEEAYEVADGVESGPSAICEELGDLLSLIALFAQIGTERALFSFDTILDGISDKLVRRHPHVFGSAHSESDTQPQISDVNDVLKQWEEIKRQERADSASKPKGLLDSLPRSLPALLKAQQIGERCARVGFDWSNAGSVSDKIEEELGEFLTEARHSGNETNDDVSRMKEEFGDLLFTLVQYGRKMGYNAEETLNTANAKFIRRFQYVERVATERFADKKLSDLGLETLDSLWVEAKTATSS